MKFSNLIISITCATSMVIASSEASGPNKNSFAESLFQKQVAKAEAQKAEQSPKKSNNNNLFNEQVEKMNMQITKALPKSIENRRKTVTETSSSDSEDSCTTDEDDLSTCSDSDDDGKGDSSSSSSCTDDDDDLPTCSDSDDDGEDSCDEEGADKKEQKVEPVVKNDDEKVVEEEAYVPKLSLAQKPESLTSSAYAKTIASGLSVAAVVSAFATLF